MLAALFDNNTCQATWLPKSLCDCYGCCLDRGEEVD